MFERINSFFKEKVGINLDVRLKNPQYWFMLIMAVVVPVASYMGLNATDITSWAILGKMVCEAFANPYLLVMVIVNVYNATIDGTTKGFKDSQMMLKGETSTDLLHEIDELKEIIEELNKNKSEDEE